MPQLYVFSTNVKTIQYLFSDTLFPLGTTDPNIMPRVQVDRGAIRHVISGANIMCPGLTSAGGHLPPDLPDETFVAVMAEGKEYAVAIGYTLMTSQEMRDQNKDIGVENVHYVGDGLFHTLSL